MQNEGPFSPIVNDSMHRNKDSGLYAAVHDHNFHKWRWCGFLWHSDRGQRRHKPPTINSQCNRVKGCWRQYSQRHTRRPIRRCTVRPRLLAAYGKCHLRRQFQRWASPTPTKGRWRAAVEPNKGLASDGSRNVAIHRGRNSECWHRMSLPLQQWLPTAWDRTNLCRENERGGHFCASTCG